MFVYNDNVIFAVTVGVVTGGSVYSFFRNGSAAALAGCLGMIVFDLFLRLRSQIDEVPLLAPDAGGHIWFIPVWILGLIGGGIGGMMWLGWL